MTQLRSGKRSVQRTPARRGSGDQPQPTEVEIAQVVGKAFPRAQPETRRALVAIADIRTFHAGETVVAQGDDRRTVFLLEGHLGLRRTTLDGREVIPRVVSTGELASLMPIAGRPAVAEAVSLSSCRVALWPGKDLESLAAGDAGFALDLLEHALLAFEAITERVDGLLHQDALRRVARVLEQHADILFGDVAVPRTYLPALVGTSREMTGRVLRGLEADGVVARLGRDRLRLLDAPRLAQIAAARSTP